MKIKEVQLSDEIIRALKVLNYNEPTEIQSLVIPSALEKRDIVAKSQTGSGKTAAFAIPLCQQADWEQMEPGALVLEPTRELTVQVREEIFCIGRYKRLKVADLFGGFPIEKQMQTLKQRNHILVGTPGRILDHYRRGTLKVSKITTLVIDEADLMLDMGFLEDVEQIIEALPRCQIMLFSATIGEGLDRLIQKYMKDPRHIKIESETETVERTEQFIVSLPPDTGSESKTKYQTFLNTLISENPDSCMIFCNTREMVNILHSHLKEEHIRCTMIHGELEQQDRLKAIDGFRQGKYRYLIATDVAARGIDFQNLTHVINYDFPMGREIYVHRIGRTGRNGQSGRAISFLDENARKMRGQVEEYIQKAIPDMAPTRPDAAVRKAFFQRQEERPVLKEKKGAGFNRSIKKLTIGGGKKSKLRAVDVVGTICSIDGVTADDIGVIDVRDSITYVDILNGKGKKVLEALQDKTIKGKVRKVRASR